MALLLRFVMAIVQVIKIVVDRFAEELVNRLVQLRLVLLDGQYVVTASLDDLLGDFLLTTHRVDRNDRALQVDLVEEFGYCRDFVRFLLGGKLS